MRTTLTKEKKSEYPCLKRPDSENAMSNYVVLFTEPGRGVVVHAGEFAVNPLGFYCGAWDERAFIHLEPGTKITIEA
jgi:hypothetical protein